MLMDANRWRMSTPARPDSAPEPSAPPTITSGEKEVDVSSVTHRIAFVTPRYGEGVVGGSEAVMAEAARGLAARGHDVEVLTTCAKSHFSWENEFESGSFEEAGITIRRFKTVSTGRHLLTSELEMRIQRGSKLSPAEELAWLNGRLRVPDLYLHLTAEATRYDAIVLSPYLFWTTIYGAEVAPDRAIMMPCLHDENYAWLRVVKETLSSVAGVWFLSEPEHQLGHRVAPGLPPHHAVVGAAVDIPASYDTDGFRARHHLTRPFVLYAGRREEGKGWNQLLSAYGAAVDSGVFPFDLVTTGVGAPNAPAAIAERVIDLGFLATEEMPSAFAAAAAVVQPSTNESFSRVLMEAWLAATPVIANAEGEVIAWHCERSGGGLTYANDAEFLECLRFIAEAPDAAAKLATAGRSYVLANYTWPLVLDRMEASLDSFVRSAAR
jgi:glycosyltransferase involved in cell wall biosynthesis